MTFLLAACGSGKGNTTSTTTSTGVGGQGSTMSTTGTMTSSSTNMSSSSTGNPQPSACTQRLLDACKQLKMCAPHVYAGAYENDDALCQSEAVRLCGTLPTALDNTNPGVMDPAACDTAISGTCNAFLASLDANHVPAACMPKPGNLAVDKPCLANAQCGAGLTCYTDGPDNCKQYCGPVGKVGRPCQAGTTAHDEVCDPTHGLHCVYPTTGGSDVCAVVSYGNVGDTCRVNSEKACNSGLYCSAMKCAQRLSDGATCTIDPANDGDPCDGRLGLSCQLIDSSKPNGGSTCQAPFYVPDNATCGMVSDAGIMHDHKCGAYSYCETNTKVCKRKAMLNEGCVVGGCFPPYECTAGTCQAPAITPDPTCSANPKPPVSTVTCGISDGGIPFACSGTTPVCCLEAASSSQVGEYTPTCIMKNSAITLCPSGSTNMLNCNDSAQCGGQKCCEVFTVLGNNTQCNPSCNQPSFEMCRMDNPSACGGAGCKAAPSTWSATVPPDMGFCTVPTCAAPADGCGTNSDCCSGKCDQSRNECN